MTSDTPPADGWYEKDGDTYFYVGGQPVTGWQTSGGFKYYFNDKGVLSSKRGIDVSVYQENIDWNAVKASGVDFVMIRVGSVSYTHLCSGAGFPLRNCPACWPPGTGRRPGRPLRQGVCFWKKSTTTGKGIYMRKTAF